MYHICHSKSKVKPFSIVSIAANGELLSSHLLKTKQACFKNVQAQLSAINDESMYSNIYVFVQDDTHFKTPIVYKVYTRSKQVTDDMPVKPKYHAGKNPKKDIGRR